MLPSQMVSKPDLYDRYRNHCQQNGVMPVGNAEFFKRIKTIFPSAKEDRVVMTVNGVKQRVRRLGLALGQFDIGQPANDPHAALNTMLTANTPYADEDFDPFKNR